MKGSISETVRSIIDNSPYIKEMLSKDFLNCSSYSAAIKPQVEKACGRQAGSNAIVMALRRYAQELSKPDVSQRTPPIIDYQIVLHTNIFDYNLEKTDSLLHKIPLLYRELPSTQREFINFIVGTNEVGIIGSEKYRAQVEQAIGDTPVLHKETGLVAFTMIFSGPFLQTPGIINEATRRLAWKDINLLELISTKNELTFVIKNADSIEAYQVLQSFQSK
ncbi:MAG: hypothetical protein ACTTJZ_05145 [Sphaerochaetaceae bacterium]